MVRRELRAQGVEQRDLAERVGKSEPHVSRVLTGRYALSLDLLEQMAAALGRHVRITLEETS